MSSAPQSLVDQWASANGLASLASGSSGQLSVTIDRVRVHLVTFRSGEVLVEARVRDLPAALAECSQLLQKALELSTARMSESAAGPAVDPAVSYLKLQTRINARSTPDDVDKAVSMIVSEVELWRGFL